MIYVKLSIRRVQNVIGSEDLMVIALSSEAFKSIDHPDCHYSNKITKREPIIRVVDNALHRKTGHRR